MKKNVKRILAAILSACLVIGCGACGNDKTPTDEPTEIVLSESDVTLKKGETLSLKVAGAELLSPSFESNNPSVVTVNADGTMKAVGVGNAVVTVKSGELSATCSVTVTQEIVYSLTFDKSAANLSVGSELSVTAHPKMSGEPLEIVVEWTVEKVGYGEAESVATYVGNDTNTLTFTGVAEGKLTVTAKANGCEATLTLTVTDDAENVENMESDQAYVLDEEQIAKRLADKTTNWADKRSLSLWSSQNGTAPSYDPTNSGISFSYFDCGNLDNDNIIGYVTFDGQILKTAAEKGYTTATLTVSGDGYPNVWLNAGGPNGMATANALARIMGTATGTIVLNLSDLLDESTGEYFLGFTIAGWWGGCSTVFQSLTFSNAEEEAKKVAEEAIKTGFASEGTNWAMEIYKGCWSSNLYGNGGIKSDSTKKTILSKYIVAAAIEKGYTKATVVVERKDVSWGTLYNGNGTEELAAHNFNANGSPATFEIDLANFTDGITVTFAGEWGGDFWIAVTSLTFSK